MNTPVRHDDGALQPRALPPTMPASEPVTVGLNAAILAMHDDEPAVAVLAGARGGEGTLPGGPFLPREHDTLEAGLCHWVRRQTGIDLGTARQLCTTGRASGRDGAGSIGTPIVAVCYLALVGPSQLGEREGAVWQSWYTHLPWEDWRNGPPECLKQQVEPLLAAWARSGQDGAARGQRARILFGLDGATWDEERVLDRYDLLREAGLLGVPGGNLPAARLPRLRHDHTRLLAAAIGELRRSIKVQPVVFELMPDTFTLFELQKTVEAILGPHLHKQNFRRLVESGGLVEQTGEHRFRTGGRPARLYRFRRGVLLERLAPGVRVKAGRA